MTMLRRLCFLMAAFMLLAPPALAQVVPISEVNADDDDGHPALWTQMVTVKGVVTVPTGLLASRNDIYIQDATGGVNVIQDLTASPFVAAGDSVLVTGRVSVANGKRTFILVNPGGAPGSRIRITSRGNPVPAPVELTAAEVMASGEDYEGSYAVVRGVTLPFPSQWPSAVQTADRATTVADGSGSCWIWFDVDSDVNGSPRPANAFDLYGVVVPDIRAVGGQPGHGILPPSRADARALGSGSGFCAVSPDRVYAGQPTTMSFALTGEGEALTRLSVGLPVGWLFSGLARDATLSGPAFAGASVVADSTGAGLVTVAGASLAYGSPGTIRLVGVVPPSSAGTGAFTVTTAVAGGVLTPIQRQPSVGVGALATAGAVLINELYAHGADSQDRSEFIELHNPGAEAVNLSGWVLTDMDDSGVCGGVNLWEFPSGASIAAGGYLVVAKDARRSASQGFQPVFGFYPDYELFDSTHGDVDHAGTPNLILVTPPNGNPAVSQEIRLLGGPDGNGTLKVNTPSYEAVFLSSDRTRANLVDAVEYRDPVYWLEDPCASFDGLGSGDDAWVPGPPQGYSLGRDASSTDTDSSRDDLFLASTPTPRAVNQPVDVGAPSASSAASVADVFATVTFSEPMDPETATDAGSYVATGGISVLEAWLSRDGRTALLRTDPQTPDQSYGLTIQGVEDRAGNVMPTASLQIFGYHDAITPIADVQAYDDNGYSPLWGEDATVVGFTTVPPGIFQAGKTSMYIEDLEQYGLNVYSPNLMTSPPLEGDLVRASGMVMEYRSINYDNPFATPPGSTTEILNASIVVVARGFDIVQPSVMPCDDVNHERNEGRFVQTSGVVTRVDGFSYYISDGTGVVQVYQNFTALDFSRFAVGDSVRVTGVVLQYDRTVPYLDGYELAPRSESDMVTCATNYAEKATIAATARVLDADAGEMVEIAWNAPRATTIEVRVFDLKGRSVRTLASGLSLSASRLAWDGRGDDGKLVPPGAYICHIKASERNGGDGSEAAVPIVVGMKLN